MHRLQALGVFAGQIGPTQLVGENQHGVGAIVRADTVALKATTTTIILLGKPAVRTILDP